MVGPGEFICGGFSFIEGPRWHNGALWFSDMHGEGVYRVEPGGNPKLVIPVSDQASGLGWLPNGDLLFVSMLNKRVMRQDASGGISVYADLSDLAERRINDMLVHPLGYAYVGNFGFLSHIGESVAPATLALILPDGQVKPAASDLLFPNGMALLPGTETLIVAETFGSRLTAFNIGHGGSLSGRRVWAKLPDGAVPDGICVDESGCVWVASPTTGDVLLLAEGGRVLASIDTGRQAIACALGGIDGHSLFVCSAVSTSRETCRHYRSAEVIAYTVEVGSG